MKHSEGTFKSVRDLKIFHQAWLPDGEVKGVLFIVHGVGEHSSRYTNVINRFLPLGFAVYALDHIGHGKSEGEREMIDKFADYSAPLITYRKMVAEQHPDVPVFIYGHSMGALITCVHLLSHQADFTGAIISAPPLMIPANISPITITIGRLLSAIAPKMGLIDLDVNNLSNDKAVVEAYVADPLVFHGKMTARISSEMLGAIKQVNDSVGKINLPLFIIQGGADHIVDPAGADMLYAKSSSSDKTLKVYDGFFHEIHNEINRELMFSDLEAWLKPRLK